MQIDNFYIPETKIVTIDQFASTEDNAVFKAKNAGHYTIPLVKPTETGEWSMIPTIKSGRYNYMDHRYAAGTYIDNLKANLEDATIVDEFGSFDTHHAVSFKNHFSKMIIHSIPDLSYTLQDVKPFETTMKSSYFTVEKDGNQVIPTDIPTETFMPRITMINDYDRICVIEFGIYRSLCKNGMAFGNVFRNQIRFSHVDKDITTRFHDETAKFIEHIFEKKLVETIFQKMEARKIKKEALESLAEKELGKRSVKKINEAFEMTDVMTLWVAYNIFTWYLSNQVKDVVRAHEASQRAFNHFYNQ